ncbi:MAG: hypothetical protein CMK89_10045 [Pseudomonadales bacterium]|nr:hypothetical protein [Pseudomonadales bacterium]
MDFVVYIMAGAAVGFAVGVTGVGGGSLMTPLLLLFGFPPHVAVGTDLLYASITKAGGVFVHRRQGTIRWNIVFYLFAGSLPASLATVYVLHNYFPDSESYSHLLTSMLGVMLILTSLVLLMRKKIMAESHDHNKGGFLAHLQAHSPRYTWLMGIVLGIMVTLSSVGAGAFGAAILLLLYPRLPSINVVGTDLAHAVPLTLVAGTGHLFLGNVDFMLLGALLVGSLPAIYVGTKVATRLPEKLLQPMLASMLLALGVKYAFF